MSEGQAEWKACATQCRQAAQVTMEASAEVTGKEVKAEFLRIATEWLKLADEIENHLAVRRT